MQALTQFAADFREYSNVFVSGLSYTLILWIGSLALATALGMLWAILDGQRVPVLGHLARGFVIFIRGVPILVQLFYIYFLLPAVGIEMSSVYAATIALGLAYSAYAAEVFRAGMKAIEGGQIEAAQSMAMSRWTIIRRVVIPQTFTYSLPGYVNIIIMVLKGTAIASVIAVPELTRGATLLGQATYKNFTIYSMLAIYYMIICVPLVVGLRSIERRSAR